MSSQAAPIGSKQAAFKAQGYSGQIGMYQAMLEKHGLTIEANYVHFPLAGTVVRMNQSRPPL